MRAVCAAGEQARIRGYLLDGFAWCETFVLLGVHCFWALSKSSPLAVDTAYSVALAGIPFLVLAFLGALSLHARMRVALEALESVFHAMASGGMTALLFFAVVQDPFSPVVPLAAPMFL